MSDNNYELYYHKRSDSIKWVLTLIAFILCGVMFAGIICGWFTKKDDTMSEGDGTETVQDGGMVASPEDDADENSAVGLSIVQIAREDFDDYGIMPLALTAYTVTATVKDTSGIAQDYLQHVDFSLAWASTNSATLSDYLTMTTTDTTATLTCKKAFSTKITLTAAASLDTTKKATVTLDYAKGFSSYAISTTKTTRPKRMGDNLTSSTVSNGSAVTLFLSNWETNNASPGSAEDNGAWQYAAMKLDLAGASFGTGTVDNSVTSITAAFSYSSAFLTAAKNLTGYSSYPFSGQTYTVTLNSSAATKSISQAELLCSMMSANSERYIGTYTSGNFTSVSNNPSIYTKAFMSLLDSTANAISCKLTLNFTYGSAVTYTFNVDVDVYQAPVGSVAVGESSHVFAV